MNWTIRPPVIVHHMAALDGQDHPPNSLEAIRACLDAGADFVEIDVTALAGADYLLVHDPELQAETTGRGPVAACTVEGARELRFVRNGSPTPYRVPLLSEVVALFVEYASAARGATRLQIDYKNLIPFPTGEPLQRFVRLIEPLGRPPNGRVIVSTGADWQLRKLRALAPWLDLGLDIHFYIDWHAPGEPVDPRVYPRHAGAYGYWDDHPLATRRIWSTADYLADRCGFLLGLVPGVSTFYVSHRFLAHSLDDGFDWAQALHRAGIRLDAWTLDVGNPEAEANALRLLRAGVDQFTTNTPRALSALLAGAPR
jgi:glycerophosphoryl diester phosphodiesterase